jgi:rieske iron-sulfur protein
MAQAVVSRRGALDLGLKAAGTMAVGAMASPRPIGPRVGDAFVAAGGADRSPLRAAAIRAGAIQAGAPPILAWPMDRQSGRIRDSARFNQVLLLRLPDATETASAAALVAFSAICQHAGCVVSGWQARDRLLLCPCHGSAYDPARGGAVVAGPAPLPLPTLPVSVVDGVVTAAGPFSGQPGGHTGRTD